MEKRNAGPGFAVALVQYRRNVDVAEELYAFLPHLGVLPHAQLLLHRHPLAGAVERRILFQFAHDDRIAASQ